jgi:succinate dehydrogenase / fumarate reductase flavoprotein subunit
MHVEGDRKFNPGLHTARDVHFMLKTSEIIVRCALERKESRGAQWRLDFPEKDPDWGRKNVIVRKGEDSKVQVATRPLPEMPAELASLFEVRSSGRQV